MKILLPNTYNNDRINLPHTDIGNTLLTSLSLKQNFQMRSIWEKGTFIVTIRKTKHFLPVFLHL